MKVIDLLNKIANGEEVPEYVQYYNMLQDKLDTMMVCKENIYYKLDNLEIQINSRVEPVEPKGIPKKLKSLNNVGNVPNLVEFADKQQLNNHLIKDKLNEIIDYLDYLKSKGDE